MNVLIIGSGGREHALAWKILQSPRVDTVFVSPGNAGTYQDAVNVDLDQDDFAAMVRFAEENEVGLTVVGPEAPLAAGIVDAFEAAGQKVFGPNKKAARLEASKVFCKQILKMAGVPTADYRAFTDPDLAIEMLEERFAGDGERPCYVVVKADGLAAGKGVTVCHTKQDALDAIEAIGRDRVFGEAGAEFIIEERLEGEEASILAITDGKTIVTLPAAQDHKPAGDGDTGPNTGGMGAYSPTPAVSDEDVRWVEENVLVPTIHALKKNGTPFKGVLYAGLMITPTGIKVLEYNVRFGDPECQPLLMRLQSDVVDILEAVADGELDRIEPPQWDPRPACCVVVASQGYPGSYKAGYEIRGLEAADSVEDVKVFHAGTSLGQFDKDRIVTSGGRVVGVTALGNTVAEAKASAYAAVECIEWNGCWCRSDISDKALAKQTIKGGLHSPELPIEDD